jgi:hypothetical protein
MDEDPLFAPTSPSSHNRMDKGSDTQASLDHHDFMDEDPPFAPTSPFSHDPINEDLKNI